MKRVRFALAAAALWAGVIAAWPASGDQNDPRLPALFDGLQAVADPAEAELIELKIWSIWMSSDDPEVNIRLAHGVERMNMGDYKTALTAFDAIVAMAPDFAEGWNKRATVLYLMGDYAASMKDVDRTLALEPRHFGALSGLGLINVGLGDDEAALDAFERALAVNPHMPGARSNAEMLRERLEGRAI